MDHTNRNILRSIIFYCQPSSITEKKFLFLSMHVIRTFMFTINAAHPETFVLEPLCKDTEHVREG
jgi:hypothetical protein